MSYQLQSFYAGDSNRTAFSAGVMNELVGAINSLLRMEVGKGLIFNSTQANTKLSLDQEYIDKLDEPGGTGSSIAFKGKWAATGSEYVVGDVVIVWDLEETYVSSADIAMKVGTYICIETHNSHIDKAPPSGTTFSNTWWTTLARGHYEHLWSYNGRTSASQACGTFYAEGGNLTVDFGTRTADAYSNTAKLTLNSDVFGDGSEGDPCPDNLLGMVFKPILVDICVDGSIKQMWVIGTDSFLSGD